MEKGIIRDWLLPIVTAAFGGIAFAITVTALTQISEQTIQERLGGSGMNEFLAALAGAVVGALASGIISYALQQSAFKQAREDRAKLDQQEQKALGQSLFVKVFDMWNTLGHLKNHALNQENAARNANGQITSSPSNYLLPLAYVGEPIQIDAAELRMLFSLKVDDIFNRVLELKNIYNSILPVWDRYAALRAELQQISSHKLNHGTGTGVMSVPKGGKEEVKLFETNGLARQLIERAKEDAAEAEETAYLLAKILNEKVGLGIKIEPNAEANVGSTPAAQS